MDSRRLRVAIAAVLAGSAGATMQMANAQQTAAGASAGGGLEEILVTATRREQNLQEVPISIVAITGDNLEMRGIDNLEEVSQSVPNVVITGGGGGTGGTQLPDAWHPERRHLHRRRLASRHGRLPDARIRRHRPRRSAARSAGHDVRPRLDRRRRSASGRSARPKSSAATSPRRRARSIAATSRRLSICRSATTSDQVDGREPESRRLHPQSDDRRKRRRRRPASVPRRHCLGRDREAGLPLQLSVRREHVHRAAYQRRHVPHLRRPGPAWVKSVIGLPEFYTYVGVDFRGNPVEPFTYRRTRSRASPAAKSASGRTARARRCRTTTTRSNCRSRRMAISDNMKLSS